MNYDLWLKNKIISMRNAKKYKRLKSYINNIKTASKDLKNRVINNMLLASFFYDKEHFTNTNKILEYYLRRYDYEW